MLDHWVIIYIDNILIYSNPLEEHFQHVRQVLQCLIQHRLFVKANKSEFHQTCISVLGCVISLMDQVQTNPSSSHPSMTASTINLFLNRSLVANPIQRRYWICEEMFGRSGVQIPSSTCRSITFFTHTSTPLVPHSSGFYYWFTLYSRQHSHSDCNGPLLQDLPLDCTTQTANWFWNCRDPL